MRVFLDTNVLVAAVATRGLCAEIFEIVIQSHELLSSREVVDELSRILREKLRTPEDIANAFVTLILDQAEMVVPGDATPSVADPDDVPILEFEAHAGLKIVSPRQFATMLLS